jgi:hypothetical protein
LEQLLPNEFVKKFLYPIFSQKIMITAKLTKINFKSNPTTEHQPKKNLSTSKKIPKVRLSGVALPTEHGSWGFLFEPLVAALIISPSISGFFAAVIYIGAFLMRQPLKIFLGNLHIKGTLAQKTAALKFIFLYVFISFAGFWGCVFYNRLESFLPAFLILPIAIFQIYLDSQRKSRELFAETAGAIAISSSAAVVALSGGWTIVNALALWTVFILRLIPSVLYVRNRLRLEKGKVFSFYIPLTAHLIALFGIFGLAAQGFIPKLIIVAFMVLTIRNIKGLSRFHRPTKAMKIGVLEVIFGLLTVLSVILGGYLQI